MLALFSMLSDTYYLFDHIEKAKLSDVYFTVHGNRNE